VNEPLNETDIGITPYPSFQRQGNGIIVTGKHRLLLSPAGAGMADLRPEMDKLFNPLTVLYGDVEETVGRMMQNQAVDSPLGYDLPVNAQLLTLERWSKDTYLLRLGHAFAVGEDEMLSQPVEVDISKLLQPLLSKSTDASIEEMSLSANQSLEAMLARRVQWSTVDEERKKLRRLSKHLRKNKSMKDPNVDSWITELSPMQIRTFFIHIS
jgi:hypothetical protein